MMLKFDFSTYVDKFINNDELNKLIVKKDEIFKKFSEDTMTGWTKPIDEEIVNKIIRVSEKIKNNSSCLVVIGIGGSFLGAYSFQEVFSKYFNDDNFKVIFAGTTYSSKYMSELLEYLENVDFSLNVISKSGTTMETSITYGYIKELMKKKYSDEELKDRIIITTDKEKGKLIEEIKEFGYESFVIPDDIGGRYSFLTPAHLLPLSLNYDINKIIKGYYEGSDLINTAYKYACIRNLLFKNGKYVENYCFFENNMMSFSEWLKQLFGETEGKNGVGILPMSTLFSRDLHSLGQFIQEGNKIIFETFIKVENSNVLKYEETDLHSINNLVLDSVVRAHYKGDVPCNVITMDEVSLENVSSLIYFFMLSAAFSGYLFGVNPFNQPGVEVYKEEVRNSLNKE